MHSLVKSWPVRETEGRYKIIREKGIFKFLWGGGEKTINKAKTLNIETMKIYLKIIEFLIQQTLSIFLQSMFHLCV